MSRIEEALAKAAQLRNDQQIVLKKNIPVPDPLSILGKYPVVPQLPVNNPCLVTVNDPHSPISEEYRKLKSILVAETRENGFKNTLAITSCVSGEGKSITSLNLAITLAQEFDHTVLLVDADLRKPSLHTYLGLTASQGLAHSLMDGTDIGNSLINTGLGKLSLLPAGKSVQNPVELFSSQRMRDLLAEMKERYSDRFIIFDTPPLLPFAETNIIASLVDNVVLVVKERQASEKHLAEAVDMLNNKSLLGFVYNNVSIVSNDDNYYYKSYSYNK